MYFLFYLSYVLCVSKTKLYLYYWLIFSFSLDPQVQPSLIEDPEFVFGDYEYSEEEEEPFYG